MKAFFIFSIVLIFGAGLIYFIQKDGPAPAETVIIQPFHGIDKTTVDYAAKNIAGVFERVEVRPFIAKPTAAFYKPRNRFRADSLIAFLKRRTPKNSTTIGMITSDISTTSRNHADWGVMGLGYTPGPSCIASTYRLSKKNVLEQFYKVCIHELGHTAGLPHCKVKTCFMRDANAQNFLNEQKGFCKDCKNYLANKGWKLK